MFKSRKMTQYLAILASVQERLLKYIYNWPKWMMAYECLSALSLQKAISLFRCLIRSRYLVTRLRLYQTLKDVNTEYDSEDSNHLSKLFGKNIICAKFSERKSFNMIIV